MKIYFNQLAPTLEQKNAPLWLVFGDEPWQKNHAIAQIKQHYYQLGFIEQLPFFADDKFDWQQLLQECQAMSLFAENKLIEVELTSNKLTDPAKKALQQACEQLGNETILLLHGTKVEASTSNTKWFKNLVAQGCYLPLYPLEGKALHQWLKQQAVQLRLQLSNDVIPLMCELFEGNLLALSQELEKLSLLYPAQPITRFQAESILINQAKFNPFQLIDSLLEGNLARCYNILQQLEQEDAPVTQLLWFINKEVEQLLEMQQAIAQGNAFAEVAKRFRIWDKRKGLYQNAVNGISQKNLLLGLSRLADTDTLLKTNSQINGYLLLADLCTCLWHGEQLAEFSLNYDYH